MQTNDKQLEDLKLTIQILSEFFTNKVKSVELYHKTGKLPEGSASTHSVYHTDGAAVPH